MPLPLYKGLHALDKPQGQENMGLWFERFYSAYPDDFSKVDDRARTAWLKDGARKQIGDSARLKSKALQLRLLAKSQGGDARVYSSTGQFVSGLGNPHPLENGFHWHPTLGMPYIPGSAVKGLLRGLIETAYAGDDKANILLRWFGSEDKKDTPERAGQFIFMDALPIEPCDLHTEVMTPHMGQWYAKGQKTPLAADTQPGDWHSPVPIAYLVARKLKLQFVIMPRSGSGSTELAQLWEALSAALLWMGAGAKTAIGFGQFKLDEDEELALAAAASIQKPSDTRIFDLDRLLRELAEQLSTCSVAEIKGKDKSNLAWKLKLTGHKLNDMNPLQRAEAKRLAALCMAIEDRKIQAHIRDFFSELHGSHN